MATVDAELALAGAWVEGAEPERARPLLRALVERGAQPPMDDERLAQATAMLADLPQAHGHGLRCAMPLASNDEERDS